MKLLGISAGIALAIAAYGFAEARRDPVLRRITLSLADWPAGASPVRAVLLSDVHFGNAAMDRDRLRRVVDRVVALKPDIVLLAGDFIAGHDAHTAARGAADLAAGLSRLNAPLGAVAVLGNHDHWTDAAVVRRALIAARITLVTNAAIRRGPLVIGGIDDQFSRHDDIPATLRAMARLPGARIILAHTPDVARALRAPQVTGRLPPVAPQLILAGHTHCGQIVLPWLGPIKTVIDRREAYLCGASRRGGDRIIVTAGIGTSVLPFRLGAPPDLWVITLGPAAAGRNVSRPRS